jgi:hypothetical protein
LGSSSAFENSSLVLAIANTAGLSNLNISYKVIKVREQNRSHDFNLEYSLTSPTAGFVAVPGGAYTSGTIAEGTVTTFSSIVLPAEISNRNSVVYIRWVYKPSASPGSGSRDGIALDDVIIASGAPSLSIGLVVNPTAFAENAGANAGTGTVTLNQTQAQDLVVNLTSSDTTEATVPASVTIPAGQLSATFAVAAVDDAVSDGSVAVTITASSGSLSATTSVTVTDNEVALNGVTPGAPNGGDNTTWVGLLRSGALNQPALFRLGAGNPPWLSINANTGLLSGTPDAAGAFTISLERYNSLNETAAQTFQLAVSSSAPDGFASWIASYAGLSDTSTSGDPDNDGIANLMEYFMGLPPNTNSASGIILSNNLSASPPTLSLIYNRSKNITGVTGGVVWSSALTNANSWTTNGVTESSVNKGSHDEVTATVTNAPGETLKFLRLRVTQP